jgi:hypothetical protein
VNTELYNTIAKNEQPEAPPHENGDGRAVNRKLDADAAMMQESATYAGQRILSMRNNLDARGGCEEPLLVLVGEDHESTQHYLHHILLLEAIEPFMGNVMIAFEQPHDLLSRFYAMNNPLKIPSNISQGIEGIDSKSALSLKLRFYGADNPYAYFAHKTLAHYILERFKQESKLSFVGTDIAYDSDEIIDYNSQQAIDSITACGGDPLDLISIHDPIGMKIRNHHMAETLRSQAQERNASIVIQFCGKAHLNGNANKHTPENSLSRYLKKAGSQICVLPLNTDGFIMPSDNLYPDEVVACHTPNGPVAEYDPRFELTSKQDDRPVQRNRLLSKKQEALYIAQKLEMFDLSHYALDLERYESLKYEYRDEVEQDFRQLLSHHQGVKSTQGLKLG